MSELWQHAREEPEAMTDDIAQQINGLPGRVREAWIRDDKEQLVVAQGRVRLLCVDESRALG